MSPSLSMSAAKTLWAPSIPLVVLAMIRLVKPSTAVVFVPFDPVAAVRRTQHVDVAVTVHVGGKHIRRTCSPDWR